MVDITNPVLLFGAAAGIFAAIAIALVTGRERGFVRWVGFSFMLATVGHALANITGRYEDANLVLWFLSANAAGLMWAFIQVLFTDRRAWTWECAAPPLILCVLALLGATLPVRFSDFAWIGYNVLVVGLMAHGAWTMWSGRANDLVEPRRRLRTPIIIAGILYILIVQASDIADIFGERLVMNPSLQAMALIALALAAAGVLLKADTMLLVEPASPGMKPPPTTVESIDPADRALAQRLEKAMGEEALWKREDLSIGSLAAHLKTPEHRLRRLINSQLGHRNFAAFVNARRIEAAKAALSDPENGRTPVSAIAFDLGFASLGPFNRAFKEATGKTPTEWRVERLRAGV